MLKRKFLTFCLPIYLQHPLWVRHFNFLVRAYGANCAHLNEVNGAIRPV